MTFNTIIKWLALICTLTGAVSTVMKLDPANIIFLNLGSLLYLIWSVRVKDLNLILVNAVLLAIYIAGAVIRAR
jgi:hypothetical protein